MVAHDQARADDIREVIREQLGAYGWTLVAKVAAIIALPGILQFGGAVWWASDTSARIAALEASRATMQASIEANRRDTQNGALASARSEAQLKSLQDTAQRTDRRVEQLDDKITRWIDARRADGTPR